MMKQCLSRLTWPARIAVLGGILLLAARVDVQTGMDGDSSVTGRLATLVSCVLPATADNPPATPAEAPETMTPNCDAPMSDRLGTAWITC